MGTGHYWQKRDAAKDEIGRVIRRRLMDRYRGLPVLAVVEDAEAIRAANKVTVGEVLRLNDCADATASWRVFMDFRDGPDGVARVWNFIVDVESVS